LSTAASNASPIGDYGAVPRELRDLDQWVLWKTARRDGKATKVPCQATAGAMNASSSDPTTWSDFDAAVDFASDPRNGAAGIGFVFSKDDGYVGVDFDGCLEAGGIADWAAPWIKQLASGFYAEVSPSGNGLKFWLKGKLPGTGGKRKIEGRDHTGIEVYDKGRFFAVTGNAFGGPCREIRDHQPFIDRLYAWVKERPARLSPPSPAPAPATIPFPAGDLEVRARAYLATVEPAVSGQGGHDATMRAACVLVRFGIDSPDAVFRILRQDYNPRCQPPWSDHELHHKAESAVANETRRDLRDAQPPKQTTAPQGAAQPKQGSSSTVNMVDAKLANKSRTDMGNGERMAHRYAHKIRYCHPWQKWLLWDGKRWKVDKTGAIHRVAKNVVRKMYGEAKTLADDDKRKQLVHHALACEARAARNNMIDAAATEPGIPVLPEDLDSDPWAFNVQNGTIDLRTGDLQIHRQDDMITQLCPVEFDPGATCPTWLATLDLFFAGDRKLIAYWQRLCGYALAGVIRDHILPIAYGVGSNGKSTILGALMDVMGPDYAMKAPRNLLMAKQQETHPTDQADLFGKRLVVAIETESGRRIDEVLIKELTGGDRIRARRMREDFWEFSPTHTLMMATNHRPVVKGTDHGIWRRLKLIPFTVTMPDDKADKAVPEKLKAEAPGILAWMVRGCLAWQQIGLEEPDSVKLSTAEYRSEQDVVGSFLAERTLVDSTLSAKCGEVYAAYKEWAESSGERVITMTQFGLTMRERGFASVKNGSKFYQGLGLRQK
jgi:putative DNA primase/helicase